MMTIMPGMYFFTMQVGTKHLLNYLAPFQGRNGSGWMVLKNHNIDQFRLLK